MRRFLAFALLLMGVSLANAQAPTPLCTPTTAGSCVPVNAANPLPISGSFSATLTGFLSNNVFATLTATNTTSASTALPTGATANPSIRITNNGTTVVSCTMATGAATGLTSNILVQPGSSVSRVVGTFDHIACIDQTGSVSNPVVIEGGSGLGNDSGGGGSGGGGGAITAASSSYAAGAFSAGVGVDGWDLTQGAKADAACAGGGSACSVSGRLAHIENELATVINNTAGYISGFSEAHLSAVGISLVAKASAGDVISISGSGVSGSFIMLFDAVSAPVDGAVTPKKCWGPLSSAGPFVFGWGIGPVLHNSTGITVVSSSTGCFTKTGTNAAFLSVEYN